MRYLILPIKLPGIDEANIMQTKNFSGGRCFGLDYCEIWSALRYFGLHNCEFLRGSPGEWKGWLSGLRWLLNWISLSLLNCSSEGTPELFHFGFSYFRAWSHTFAHAIILQGKCSCPHIHSSSNSYSKCLGQIGIKDFLCLQMQASRLTHKVGLDERSRLRTQSLLLITLVQSLSELRVISVSSEDTSF